MKTHKIMKTKLSQTINFHLTKACNFHCSFCFTMFDDIEKGLNKSQHLTIIKMIAESEYFDKINFTGREPTLIKYLPELIEYAQKLGLKTGMITNSWLLTSDYLMQLIPYLNTLIISIDSFFHETNLIIGRECRQQTLSFEHYLRIANFCHEHGITLKINTVANNFNQKEVLTDYINQLSPKRWKIQRVTKIEGQNAKTFSEFEISDDVFYEFVQRNRQSLKKEIKFSVYDYDKVKNAYLLMDPLGRLYTDCLGTHVYTSSVLEIGLNKAYELLKGFVNNLSW